MQAYLYLSAYRYVGVTSGIYITCMLMNSFVGWSEDSIVCLNPFVACQCMRTYLYVCGVLQLSVGGNRWLWMYLCWFLNFDLFGFGNEICIIVE